jgi:hypothetical protein
MTKGYEDLDDVKRHWKDLFDMAANGQILKVFGFGDPDDDADVLLENQLYKPIVGYMELTGKTFDEAHDELLAYYGAGDAYREAHNA